MKTLITTLFICLAAMGMQAQTVTQYQYWFDTNFANAQTVNAVGTEWIANIDASSLTSNEKHWLHFRALQDNGAWSVVTSSLFVVKINTMITTYEHWFDNDFVNRTTTNFANSNIHFETDAIDLSLLSSGKHTLNFRFKNQTGTWSSVNTQEVMKKSNLVAAQYWFDNDYANRVTNPLAPIELFSLNAAILTNTLTLAGNHTVNVRYKSDDGTWSSVTRSSFIINPKIDAFEYWFDNDYANKVTNNAFAPSQSIDVANFIAAVPTNGTEHIVHYRTHQTDGSWSATISQEFRNPNQNVALQYWYGTDMNSIHNLSLSQNNPLDWNTALDVSDAPFGTDTINIRFKDLNNRWSSTISSLFCHNSGDSNLTLKVLLAGFYEGNGDMRTVLFNSGESANQNISDTIEVTLRNSTAPYDLFDSKKTVLDLQGNTTLNFPTANNFYYLTIKHRNSLETWSANPIFLGVCNAQYDFTTADTKAYGANQKEVEPGVWAIHSGDMNQNGAVESNDFSYWETDANNFAAGYLISDLNGNGATESEDYTLWENNANIFIGTITP